MSNYVTPALMKSAGASNPLAEIKARKIEPGAPATSTTVVAEARFGRWREEEKLLRKPRN